jgi:serine/threonine protein kinase
MPNWRADFPFYPTKTVAQVLPQLATIEPYAVDLLSRMLVYQPDRRISAEEALLHPYFQSIRH